jgi:glucokinase
VKTKAVIALDLGGTKLASSLFFADGSKLGEQSVSLDSRSGAAVGQLVVSEIGRLQKLARRRSLKVVAVGICVPGIVGARSGRVWAPNIAGWEDYPLGAEIRSAVANNKPKVTVTDDRAASILGEAWHGAARGCRNAIFLAVGTGIGAGILVDGRVLRGAHGIAGAIGWLALDRPFKPQYVGCGCFEHHASGAGLTKTAKEILAKRKSYRGSLRQKSDIIARDIFAAHEQGDEIAKEVIGQAIEFWGMACSNLISLFNPEKIVFGGGVFGPASKFLDAIAAEARHWAQPVAMERVTFVASQVGGGAALEGTAYAALRAARLRPYVPKSA